jgi:hypothetical protein
MLRSVIGEEDLVGLRRVPAVVVVLVVLAGGIAAAAVV